MDGEERAPFPSVRWVAQSFVMRAKTAMACVGSVLLVIGVLVMALDLMAQTPQNNGDFFIRDARTVQEWDAVDLARDHILEHGLGTDDSEKANQPQTIDNREFTIFLLYKARDGGSVARPELLAEIQTLEARLLNDPEYDNLCLKASNPALKTPAELAARRCLPPYMFVEAPADAAQGTQDVPYPRLAPDDSAAQLDAKMSMYAELASLASLRDIFWDADFGDEGALASTYARSMFPMGLPLADDGSGSPFRGEDDRIEEQRRAFDDRIAAFRDYVAFEYDPDEEKPLQVIISGFRPLQYFFNTAANGDLVWATGSVMIVWIYVSFHMQSIFVGSMVMGIVLFTIPSALFVYKIVLGISFYQALTQLSIYIILALGADSAFVYVDAWNQAPDRAGFTLIDRVEYTLRRASKAILVPSLTTCVAFLATAVSDIMPIATFGIFSACLVVTNYVLDMTLLPAVVVVWERSVRAKERRCLRLSEQSERHDLIHYRKSMRKLALGKGGEAADGDAEQAAATKADPEAAATASPTAEASSSSKQRTPKLGEIRAAAASFRGEGDMPHPRLLERFFRDHWIQNISGLTPITVAAFLALFLGMVYSASTLKPLSQTEQWFPDAHPVRLAQTWPQDHFSRTDRDKTVEVDVVWGVLGVDREGADKYDTSQRGVPIWDAAFDVSSPAAQQYILDTCNDPAAPGALDKCFMAAFKEHVEAEGGAFPVVAPAGEDQRQVFESQLRAWAQDTSVGRDFATGGAVGFNADGSLAMCEIGFVTDLELFKPYDVTVPVYREWQAWLDGRNAAAPAGVARALQVAGVSWTWVFSERAMVTNAVQGVIVALVAAWIVLIASTRNVVVGSLASVSIIGIVACVLGLVGALKWEMGTTESISCVIVVGMSVDYVVHIASSYVESEAKTRRKRITRALEEMGISVVAGAMTTLGAGLFLAPAVLIFFKKFAVLIAATIIFSLLWSLVMFPSLLLVWGPEGDYGSFRAIAAGARRWCGRGRGSGEGEGQDAGKDDGDVELTTAVADAAETPVATLG